MTKLNLETYARLLANVACRRGASLGGILAEIGVETEDLLKEEPALREQLAGLWDNRKGVSAMKFAAALGAELQRLGALGGDGAAAGPPALVPVLAEAPASSDVATPSYLQTPAATAHGSAVMPPPIAPSPAPATPIAPPAMIPMAPRTASPLAGTASVDVSAVVAAIQQRATPFAPASPAVAPPEPAEERTSGGKRAPVGSGTVDANTLTAAVAAARGRLPFTRPGNSDLPQLPLETYASLSGALASGEPRDEVLRRHGLTASDFDTLAKAWGQRFQQDPRLLERYKELARNRAATGRGGDGPR